MLEDIELFQGLSTAELATIESFAIRKTYRKNTVVVEKGDQAASLYIILSGTAKAYIADENGKEIILSSMHQGEYFGELALLGESERTASVITTEDSTVALISKMAFTQCVAKNPEIAINLIAELIRRIDHLTCKVSDLGLKDVYGRVSGMLQQRAVEENGKKITERMTQQQIADEVGSSREMVTRILKDLKLGGYLTVEGGRYTIEKKLPAKW